VQVSLSPHGTWCDRGTISGGITLTTPPLVAILNKKQGGVVSVKLLWVKQ